MVDGLARVNRTLCTGCGICTKACPNHLISLIPAAAKIVVGCSSQDKGAITKKACGVGCIGCKKCEKTCPNGAISVKNNLAVLDPERCTGCGACVESCPVGCICQVC